MKSSGLCSHLSLDYEMLRIILKKWGLKKNLQAKFCQSNDKDMQNPLCLMHNKKKYLLKSEFVKKKKIFEI